MSPCLFNDLATFRSRRINNKIVKPYERFQSQGHLRMAYRYNEFNAYSLLNCRDNSTLIVRLSRPTVTLHQGQGHGNEHAQIVPCTVMLSLNAIAKTLSAIWLYYSTS